MRSVPRDDRALPQGSVRVLSSRAAWAGAGVSVAAGVVVVAAVVAWLWGMVERGDVVDLVDSTTWLLAGLAASFAWRLALLGCMASGALWSRARGTGHDLTTGQLTGRVAERAWLLAKLAAGWVLWSRLLRWLSQRSRWLRWLGRAARAGVAASVMAGVVSVARRELPDSAAQAKRSGRALVGGRMAVLANLVLIGAGALPLVAAGVLGGVWALPRLGGPVLLVGSGAAALLASAGLGLVIGARLWRVADKRGRKHAARQQRRSWWG